MKKPLRLEEEVAPPGSMGDPDMGSMSVENPAPPPAPVDPSVSDDAAVDAMTDIMGGGGDARFRSKRILARFAELGWRIVKGN